VLGAGVGKLRLEAGRARGPHVFMADQWYQYWYSSSRMGTQAPASIFLPLDSGKEPVREWLKPLCGGPEGDRRGRHGRGVLVANRHAAGSSALAANCERCAMDCRGTGLRGFLFCVEQDARPCGH